MEKVLLKKYKEMDEGERKKLKELLRDKEKSEGGSEKIGWLYKPSKPDAEEYLLGKRIDKNVDRDLEKETKIQDAPGASFTEVVSRRAEMDMMVKMREDPLFAIRRQEEEQRQRVLKNPVKMKMIMKEIEEKNEKLKKKKKKVKKEKKSHRKHANESSSEGSEDELLRKYLAIVEMKKKKEQRNDKKQDGNSDSKGQSSVDKSRSKRSEKMGGSDGRQYKGNHSDNNGERTKERSRRGYESEDDYNDRPSKKSRHYSSDKTKDDKSPEMKRSRRLEGKEKDNRRSTSPVDRRKREDHAPSTKRKLTSEEMERKRAEMMENARLCAEERQANVKRYKEEDEECERKTNKRNKEGAHFIKPMLMKHTEKSSVEDRIKRNVYNIQRTASDLDKDFTKR